MNVVDVNVTIKSKATIDHIFKDKKPRKTNSPADEEKEK